MGKCYQVLSSFVIKRRAKIHAVAIILRRHAIGLPKQEDEALSVRVWAACNKTPIESLGSLSIHYNDTLIKTVTIVRNNAGNASE